jgi:hypothetical protein
MAKSVKALINPAMLAWARAQAGFSPDEAARRLHISVFYADNRDRPYETYLRSDRAFVVENHLDHLRIDETI